MQETEVVEEDQRASPGSFDRYGGRWPAAAFEPADRPASHGFEGSAVTGRRGQNRRRKQQQCTARSCVQAILHVIIAPAIVDIRLTTSLSHPRMPPRYTEDVPHE